MILYKLKLLIVCILAVLLYACVKPGSGGVLSNNVYITVLDQDGNDLLDPENPFAIDLSQVKVYYLLNDVKTEINRGNLDYPKMFRVIEPGSDMENYTISLFMNTEDDSDITTTYFQWETDNTDVFKSQIRRPRGGSIFNQKTWVNDDLICDASLDAGICEVTIVFDE